MDTTTYDNFCGYDNGVCDTVSGVQREWKILERTYNPTYCVNKTQTNSLYCKKMVLLMNTQVCEGSCCDHVTFITPWEVFNST